MDTIEKLTEIFNTYTKIYTYINTTRGINIEDYYSACYTVPNWAKDVMSTNTYNVLLKYNLFELKSQAIEKTDLDLINKILK